MPDTVQELRTCPSVPRRSITVATAALAVVATGALVADGGGERPATAAAPARLTVTGSPASDLLRPGAVVSGVLSVRNAGAEPVRVRDVVLSSPSSEDCGATGVSLAPTIPPTPEAPLLVPADGTATLELDRLHGRQRRPRLPGRDADQRGAARRRARGHRHAHRGHARPAAAAHRRAHHQHPRRRALERRAPPPTRAGSSSGRASAPTTGSRRAGAVPAVRSGRWPAPTPASPPAPPTPTGSRCAPGTGT